jgi:hypothetical protein
MLKIGDKMPKLLWGGEMSLFTLGITASVLVDTKATHTCLHLFVYGTGFWTAQNHDFIFRLWYRISQDLG